MPATPSTSDSVRIRHPLHDASALCSPARSDKKPAARSPEEMSPSSGKSNERRTLKRPPHIETPSSTLTPSMRQRNAPIVPHIRAADNKGNAGINMRKTVNELEQSLERREQENLNLKILVRELEAEREGIETDVVEHNMSFNAHLLHAAANKEHSSRFHREAAANSNVSRSPFLLPARYLTTSPILPEESPTTLGHSPTSLEYGMGAGAIFSIIGGKAQTPKAINDPGEVECGDVMILGGIDNDVVVDSRRSSVGEVVRGIAGPGLFGEQTVEGASEGLDGGSYGSNTYHEETRGLRAKLNELSSKLSHAEACRQEAQTQLQHAEQRLVKQEEASQANVLAQKQLVAELQQKLLEQSETDAAQLTRLQEKLQKAQAREREWESQREHTTRTGKAQAREREIELEREIERFSQRERATDVEMKELVTKNSDFRATVMQQEACIAELKTQLACDSALIVQLRNRVEQQEGQLVEQAAQLCQQEAQMLELEREVQQQKAWESLGCPKDGENVELAKLSNENVAESSVQSVQRIGDAPLEAAEPGGMGGTASLERQICDLKSDKERLSSLLLEEQRLSRMLVSELTDSHNLVVALQRLDVPAHAIGHVSAGAKPKIAEEEIRGPCDGTKAPGAREIALTDGVRNMGHAQGDSAVGDVLYHQVQAQVGKGVDEHTPEASSGLSGDSSGSALAVGNTARHDDGLVRRVDQLESKEKLFHDFQVESGRELRRLQERLQELQTGLDGLGKERASGLSRDRSLAVSVSPPQIATVETEARLRKRIMELEREMGVWRGAGIDDSMDGGNWASQRSIRVSETSRSFHRPDPLMSATSSPPRVVYRSSPPERPKTLSPYSGARAQKVEALLEDVTRLLHSSPFVSRRRERLSPNAQGVPESGTGQIGEQGLTHETTGTWTTEPHSRLLSESNPLSYDGSLHSDIRDRVDDDNCPRIVLEKWRERGKKNSATLALALNKWQEREREFVRVHKDASWINDL